MIRMSFKGILILDNKALAKKLLTPIGCYSCLASIWHQLLKI